VEYHHRYVITFFENEDKIVLASTYLQGSEYDNKEDYIARFQELIPEEFISGMAELMLSTGQ
jgi:hypothetical protein